MALYHSAKGPNNYTIEGEVPIVNGIASISGGSNYLRFLQSFDFAEDSYEIVIKASIFADSYNPLLGCRNNDHRIFLLGGTRIDYSLSSLGLSGRINNTNLNLNQYYYFRIKKEGNTVKIGYSSDNFTYTEETLTITQEVANTSYIELGHCTNSLANRNSLEGNIDLNNTYIKVKGQAWFGLCPIEVNKVVINRPLPSGYTQVEYIDTDGSSWIDTGIVPTATTLQVDYKMQILQQDYISLFGAVSSTTPRDGFRVFYQPSTSAAYIVWQSGGFSGQQSIIWNTVLEGTVRVETQTNEIVSTINGQTQTIPSTSSYNTNLTLDNTMLIGTTHLGTSTSGRSPSRIWYLKITKEGAVVFNGIPCKRNSDNVLGMYDTVTGNFLTNAGTGTFTAGADVVPSQNIPTEVNYVIKDGKLVWADPKIYLRSSTAANGIFCTDTINTHYTYDLKFRYNQDYPLGYSNRMCPMGRWASSNDSQFGLDYYAPNSTGRFIMDLQRYFPPVTEEYITDPYGPIELKATISNGYKSVYFKNGSSTYKATGTSQAPNNSVAGYTLFGKHGDYTSSGDIYFIKLFNENGVLVRHLVPVPAGMVIGNITVDTNRMFDIVTQTLFGSVQGGDFTIGRDE